MCDGVVNKPICDEQIKAAADQLEAALVDATDKVKATMQFPAPKLAKKFGVLRAEPEEVGFEYDRYEGRILSKSYDDRFVAATPAEVADIVSQGDTVYVEVGAGDNAGYTDLEYSEAGAFIVSSAEDVFRTCDIVATAGQISLDECAMMRDGQIVFGILYPARRGDVVKALLDKKVTSIAMEKARVEGPEKCHALDIAWENTSLTNRTRLTQYESVLVKGIEVACADNGYLRAALITHAGCLTNKKTGFLLDLPWDDVDELLGIDRWTLDPMPQDL